MICFSFYKKQSWEGFRTQVGIKDNLESEQFYDNYLGKQLNIHYETLVAMNCLQLKCMMNRG